jgi:hypothetical protein
MRNLLAAALLLCALPAHAYVCTAVPGSPNGNTVWWEARTVHVVQHQRCSDDVVDAAACKQAVRDSMAPWNNVDCTDFTLVEDGETTDERVGYDWRRPGENHNAVIFREGHADNPFDDWTHQASALAITTVTFNSRTGRILDADIEVNGVPHGRAEFKFAVCAPGGTDCAGKNDLQNTLTHEFGHVLGLDHPPNPEATMYGSAQQAETKKRDLAQDDIDGICRIYPTGQAATPCTPAVDNGLPDPQFRQLRECDDTSRDPCDRRLPFSCAQAEGAGMAPLALFLWLLRRR